MRTDVTEGSVIVHLDDEAGRGAEVWVTGYYPGLLEGDAYDLAPGETAVIDDGNGTVTRVGEKVVVWTSQAVKHQPEKVAVEAA